MKMLKQRELFHTINQRPELQLVFLNISKTCTGEEAAENDFTILPSSHHSVRCPRQYERQDMDDRHLQRLHHLSTKDLFSGFLIFVLFIHRQI